MREAGWEERKGEKLVDKWNGGAEEGAEPSYFKSFDATLLPLAPKPRSADTAKKKDLFNCQEARTK